MSEQVWSDCDALGQVQRHSHQDRNVVKKAFAALDQILRQYMRKHKTPRSE